MGELPHLKALVERYPSAEFAILGVNTDSDRDVFRARCAESGVTWTNLFQGSTSGPIPRAWGVDAYPTTFVLDPAGVIRSDAARGEELERLVAQLIAEARAARGE